MSYTHVTQVIIYLRNQWSLASQIANFIKDTETSQRLVFAVWEASEMRCIAEVVATVKVFWISILFCLHYGMAIQDSSQFMYSIYVRIIVVHFQVKPSDFRYLIDFSDFLDWKYLGSPPQSSHVCVKIIKKLIIRIYWFYLDNWEAQKDCQITESDWLRICWWRGFRSFWVLGDHSRNFAWEDRSMIGTSNEI